MGSSEVLVLQTLPLCLSISLIGISWFFQTRYILQNWKKYKTISEMYQMSEYRRSFKIGLILTGILQIGLAFAINFPPNFNAMYAGKIFFIVGAIGGVLLGLFSLKENLIIHLIASYQYFFGLAIGAVLITIQSHLLLPLQIMSLGVVGIWVLIIFLQISRKNGVYAIEASHVLLSYVWIILIGLMHLFL